MGGARRGRGGVSQDGRRGGARQGEGGKVPDRMGGARGWVGGRGCQARKEWESARQRRGGVGARQSRRREGARHKGGEEGARQEGARQREGGKYRWREHGKVPGRGRKERYQAGMRGGKSQRGGWVGVCQSWKPCTTGGRRKVPGWWGWVPGRGGRESGVGEDIRKGGGEEDARREEGGCQVRGRCQARDKGGDARVRRGRCQTGGKRDARHGEGMPGRR